LVGALPWGIDGQGSVAFQAILLLRDGFTAMIATQMVALGGQTLRKGSEVYLVLGAANRDPERFPDPDRLDVARADNPHLAFGAGIHYCVGAPLARIEAQIAIRTLVQRMPNLRLATDRIEWRPTVGFRALKALPLAF